MSLISVTDGYLQDVNSADYIAVTIMGGQLSADMLHTVLALNGNDVDYLSLWSAIEISADFLHAVLVMNDNASADFINLNLTEENSTDVLMALLSETVSDDFLSLILAENQYSIDVLHTLFRHNRNITGVKVEPRYGYDKRTNKQSMLGWKITKEGA